MRKLKNILKSHVLLICPVSVSSIYVTLREHKNNNHFLWLLILKEEEKNMQNKMVKHNTRWIIFFFSAVALKYSVDDRIAWPYTFFMMRFSFLFCYHNHLKKYDTPRKKEQQHN